ncbi:hypothetical protein [Flindersiella endophytica]
MRLGELAEAVGVERFQAACENAWATAAGTGTRLDRDPPWPDGLQDLPHELADVVEGDLALAFELYRAMPCYANLTYVGYWGVGPAFWGELRALLDEADERLHDPVLYWLWCGPFEGGEEESAEAWREVTAGADDGRLRRLLRASGPVTWEAKAALLGRLVGQAVWQPVVLSAIEDAAYDYFGRIDVPEARRLLGRIREVPAELLSRLDEVEARRAERVAEDGRKGKQKKSRKQTRRQAKPQGRSRGRG